MTSLSTFRTVRVLIATCGVALITGGCGLSSITSGLGGGMFGGKSDGKGEVKSVTEEQMLAAAKSDPTGGTLAVDVASVCPRFVVWPRDNTLTIYEPGKVGDGLAIVHRGEITKTARECQIESGRVTVKYGFSGQVLLGPRGKSGNVSLPLQVYVTDAKRERIMTEKVKADVQIVLDNPIGYFSIVRTITFKIPEGARPADYEVFVGFERNVPGAG